jgi:hypothetical protein
MSRLLIGLDPGVSTGLAVWDLATQRLTAVETLAIHVAMDTVRSHLAADMLAGVRFEDARQRTWFGGADARTARSGAGIREGVGSVKRDCTIWQDLLGELGVPFDAVKPAAGSTKWSAAQFRSATGWTARTSEHGRDAALLVYGFTEARWQRQLSVMA